jgi:hypothetical protein
MLTATMDKAVSSRSCDGFCRQWALLGKRLSFLNHLLLAVRNRHRQVCFALNVAYLLNHLSALFDELHDALVNRIDLVTICCWLLYQQLDPQRTVS